MNSTAARIVDEALLLPVEDRVRLAQTLWESVHGESPVNAQDEAEALVKAKKRDDELSNGTVEERSHEEVMHRARNEIPCE